MATKTKEKAPSPPVEYASAMDKLRDEMAKSQGKYVQVVGEYMTAYLLRHPEAEAAILSEDKTIAGSLKVMEAEARKVKTGNVAVLDDQTAFGIVLQYYGLNAGDVSKTGGNVHNTPGDVSKTGGNVLNTPGDVSKTGGNVHNTPGDVSKTGGNVLNTPGNVTERLADQKPSPVGEGGSAPALSNEAPDLFDLEALLGVM